MKNVLIFAITLFSLSLAAQVPGTSLKVVPGDKDTFWLVDSNTRDIQSGQKIVEQVWTPVVGLDSLKNYLLTVERVLEQADAEIERQKQTRSAAKKEVRRVRTELAGEGQTKTTLKQPMLLDSPDASAAKLTPGEYIWDGEKLIPKPTVKKAPAKKKKQ